MHPEVRNIWEANREEITATAKALEEAGYTVRYYGAGWFDGPLAGWYGIEMLAWDRSGRLGFVFRWPPTGKEDLPAVALSQVALARK